MLKIRLQRIGKKNAPSYRVVLAEHTASPQGKFLEILGFYNPRKKEKSFKKERIEHWLSKGAQLSPTVFNLLVDEKIIKEPKRKAWKPKKKAVEKAESAQTSSSESESFSKEEKEPATTLLDSAKQADHPQDEKTEEKPKEESKEDKKGIEKTDEEKPGKDINNEKPIKEKKEKSEELEKSQVDKKATIDKQQ